VIACVVLFLNQFCAVAQNGQEAGMRQVSVVRVTRRQITTTVLGALAATAAIQGIANAGQEARDVSVSLSPVAQASPAPAPPPVHARTTQSWMAAGFIGSSFSTGGGLAVQSDANDGGLTYGFQIGYIRRYLGGEFIGDFAPTFKIASLALSDHPSVNSNMFNLVGMVPIAERFEPYISGGIGAISMSTNTFVIAGTTTLAGNTLVNLDTVSASQTKFGTDIGGGFFAFAGKWGVRGDIRCYNTSTNDPGKNLTGTPSDTFTQSLLSGLSFWRGNMGVAYRW
jgi:hypothetical protein